MGSAGRERSERELLGAWERRCEAEGTAHHCTGPEASALALALDRAVQRGAHSPELGRAARNWGRRFATPVEAVSAVLQLRDAIAEGAGPGALAHPDRLALVFDQVVMEVVDAASANLRNVARIDALTGCANRRALDEELVHTLASARRTGMDLSVAALDLDGLKVINDTDGHPAGDAALVSLVDALRRALRKADTLYRTGGDEFVVVAPFTDDEGVRSLMRRAEQMGGPRFSWGVASTATRGPGAAGTLESEAAALLAAADQDLYARRRARRREEAWARRKRRAAVVASVAASAGVTSGAVWAATLGGAPAGLSAQGAPGAGRPPAGTGGWSAVGLDLPHGATARPGGGSSSTANVGLAASGAPAAATVRSTGGALVPPSATSASSGGIVSVVSIVRRSTVPSGASGARGAPSGPGGTAGGHVAPGTSSTPPARTPPGKPPVPVGYGPGGGPNGHGPGGGPNGHGPGGGPNGHGPGGGPNGHGPGGGPNGHGPGGGPNGHGPGSVAGGVIAQARMAPPGAGGPGGGPGHGGPGQDGAGQDGAGQGAPGHGDPFVAGPRS